MIAIQKAHLWTQYDLRKSKVAYNNLKQKEGEGSKSGDNFPNYVCPPGLLQYIKAFFVNGGSRELQGTPQG